MERQKLLTRNKPCTRCFTHSNKSVFIVVEKVYRVLIQILPVVVVAHHSLRVSVSGHHLHLPVREALIQRFGDRRPPQVVRRELPYSAVLTPPADNVPGHRGRYRLVEDERAVVRVRLEEVSLRAAAAEHRPSRPIQLQVFIHRLLDFLRQRDGPLPSPLTLNLSVQRPWLQRIEDALSEQASATRRLVRSISSSKA